MYNLPIHVHLLFGSACCLQISEVNSHLCVCIQIPLWTSPAAMYYSFAINMQPKIKGFLQCWKRKTFGVTKDNKMNILELSAAHFYGALRIKLHRFS